MNVACQKMYRLKQQYAIKFSSTRAIKQMVLNMCLSFKTEVRFKERKKTP